MSKATVGELVGHQVGRTVETIGSLGDYLREQRTGARLSLRQLADLTGVSNPYLSQIERGLRRPSADVLQSLAKALRVSADQLYTRAGIVSPQEGVGGSVELAVLGDAGLSERQKQALLDIYAAFLAVNAHPTAEPATADSTPTPVTPVARAPDQAPQSQPPTLDSLER